MMHNDNIIFIDIETVTGEKRYEDLSPTFQALRDKKSAYLCEKNNYTPAEAYADKAGIFAEFGKIVCIVIGFYKEKFGNDEFIIKTFQGDDEGQVLRDFFETVRQWGPGYGLCGHNIIEFDLPYICRRAIINGQKIPPLLNNQGKKPREILHIDTMRLWKFGDYKNYVSLNLLAAVLGLPTSKDDIDGSQVSAVYHQENNLPRIATYCEKDVKLTAKVYFALTDQREKINNID